MRHVRLPDPIVELVDALPRPAPKRVRLHQRGEMRMKPGGRWLDWTGVEDMAVGRVAFSWRARFPMFPGVWLDVEDAYGASGGTLAGKLWGRLPLFTKRGHDVDTAQALRYLAELAWVPYAFERNAALEMEMMTGDIVRVSTVVGGESVAVDLTFDSAGRITEAFAPARPFEEGTAFPWRGKLADHALVDGVFLPRYGEVAWELPEGPFTYWRGEVVGYDLAM